jgi:hypothetical protein
VTEFSNPTRDWVANGLLFDVYHLHVPSVIPATLLDTFILAYPTKRYRSAWIGSPCTAPRAQSVVFAATPQVFSMTPQVFASYTRARAE